MLSDRIARMTNEIFFEVHSGLPREAPGDDASTLRALKMMADLPPSPRILDIGCGPGAQSILLARETGARVTAVDTHQPFLDEAQRRAREAGLAERVITRNQSMDALDFPAGSFDAIWCEGAAYIMGVARALRAWQKLLKPRGYLAFTDAVWLTDNPAPEALAFWEASYPAMQNIADLLVACAAAGYEILGQFVLPESSWMENYYKPMEARIEALREKYRDNPPALLALDEEQAEIEIYRKYHDAYGYAFAVLRLL